MIGTLLTKSAFGELRSMLERHREMTNGNASYLGSMPQVPFGPSHFNHHQHHHLDHEVHQPQSNHKPLFRTFEGHRDLYSMGSNASDEGVVMSNGVPEEPENIKAKQHNNNNHNHHRHHHHNNNNNNNNNNNKFSNKQVLIEDTMQVNNAEANPTTTTKTTTTSSTSSCLSSSSSSSSSSIISSPDEKISPTTTTTSGGSGVTPRLVGGAAASATALATAPTATMDSEEIGQRSTLSIQNRDKQQMIQVKSDASLLAQTSSQSESMEHFNLLQSQLGLSTQQLQHLVQNQSFQTKPSVDQTRKQLEHLLQMNLFQQAHLINGSTSEKLSGSLRNLQAQQQDLMTQLHGGKPMGVDRNGPGMFPSKTFPADQPKREPQGSHPLYSHGICRWTGCETPFPSFKEFKMHIDKDHVLSDRSTAQTRVQVQIVSQLEIQLKKEKDRLNAMMSHLHPTKNGKHFQEQEEDQKPILNPHHEGLIGGGIGGDDNRPMDTSFNGLSALQSLALPFHALSGNAGPMGRGPLLGLNSNGLTMPHRSGELKVEKGVPKLQIPNSPYHQSHLEDYCSRGPRNQDGRSGSGSNLDIENEISRNREFYRTNDVRPPFTYAALIRQGIIESPDRQLTLNEIYTWFQNTFAYFRRNAATWKNAVRHNLSLHKCFMRVENVKGAVWTVDELEYHRRRPQRGANGGSGSSVGSSSSASRSPPFNSSPSMHFNGNDMAHHYPLGGLTLAEQQAAYLHGLGISLNSSLEVARSPSPRSHHSMGQHFNSRSPRRVEDFMRNQHHNNRSQSRSPMPLSPPSSSSHDMYALEQARHAHGHHPSMRFSRSNPSPRPSDPSDFLVIKEEFGHENSESNETGMDDGQTATASRSNSFTPPESPRDEDREPTPEDLSKNRPMSPAMEEDQA
ncbi:forkhead box protein P4-like isoform X2 [Tigriopus californicus]|uniref:forkhead box protein P4-like isoform X2 n=1 Tax=Tigriopus californicus TaxID=6832 RepID=UPI0027D9F0CC|nr:forkhead box protein P4-like isoform X2 [Tigriopus californicus]